MQSAEPSWETALYGRDEELNKLFALYHLTRARSGQAVLIAGEPGLGKTRLVHELITRLLDDGEHVHVLTGSHSSGTATMPGDAFGAAFRGHFGDDGLAETFATHLGPTPLLAPAFAAHLRGHAPPAHIVPLTRDLLRTAFLNATRALAAERPTIVAIDDLHLAAEEDRRLFLDLASGIAESRVLLIATARPGLPETWMADFLELANASILRPARLDPADISRMLADVLGSAGLARDLDRLIVQKSDGNPYFILEIVRSLREAAVITRDPGGAWVRHRDVREIETPRSVKELIGARVALLSTEERELLEIASCAGFEFDPLLVGEALGVERIPILIRFDRLERAHHLIRVVGTRYTFHHRQVQEILYAALTEGHRLRCHGLLAEALAARMNAPGRDGLAPSGELALGLADHQLRSSRPAGAGPYITPALEHLRVRNRNEETVRLGQRALAVPGLLAGEERLAVLLRVTEALNQLGWREEQQAALGELLRKAEEIGSPSWLARARHARGGFLIFQSNYQEARDELGQALAFARDARDPDEESAIVNGLATLHWYVGEYEQARSLFARSFHHFEQVGNKARAATAIGNLGLVSWTLGRLEEALAYHGRHLVLSGEIADLAGELRAHTNLGIVHGDLGHHSEAMACQERAIKLARDLGNPLSEAIATGNLADLYCARAQFDSARIHIHRHLTICRQVHYRAGEVLALVNLGALHLALGDHDKARSWLTEARDISVKIGARRMESHTRRYLGECARAGGDLDGAERLIHDALEIQRQIGDRRGLAETLVAIGRLHVTAGRSGGAQASLEEALLLATEMGAVSQIVLAAAYLASRSTGDLARAQAAFAAHESRLDLGSCMEALFRLWHATRDPLHLARAHDILELTRKNAPAEYRATMLDSVPLCREIQAAWAAQAR